MWSRVTFSRKMLLWRGIQGASKSPLGASNSKWYPSYGCPLMENPRDGRPKIAIFHDFWQFSNFNVFLKGEPRGFQNQKRDLPNSCDIWENCNFCLALLHVLQWNRNLRIIFQVLQLFGRFRLGFWMTLGSPFKNTLKLEKCQKPREIAYFGRPSLELSIENWILTRP